MLSEVDLLLVVGSRNSSNSNRLVEVAHAGGVASYLIDDATEIDEAWLDGVSRGRRHVWRVGAGEARPGRLRLVSRARCDRHRAVQPLDEDVEFRLPAELRRELALAETQS